MEQYRNNALYLDSELMPELCVCNITEVQSGDDFIDGISIIEDHLYVSANEVLICYEITKKEEKWSIKFDSETYTPIDGGAGKILLPLDTGVVCLDAVSGEKLWQVEADEFPKKTSQNYIYMRGDYEEPEPVVCRLKKDGTVKWILKGLHGAFNLTAAENGLVVLQGFEGFHTCVEDNGEVLWHDTRAGWLKKCFPNKKYGPFASMGPLINGLLFVGFRGGLLVAIEAKSGVLVWAYELDIPDCPMTILYKDNKVIFNIDQGWGKNNYLTCLCANTGKCLFKSTENITPVGCGPLIAVDRYVIGGNGPYLTFFDTEKMEFSYRYKYENKENAFSGNMIPTKDQLITFNGELKKIYWFKNKGK